MTDSNKSQLKKRYFCLKETQINNSLDKWLDGEEDETETG